MPAENASPQLSRLLAGHPPEPVALVHEGRHWTYGDVAAAAGALAAEMDQLAGERVAFMLPTCPEAALVYLACFRSGAVATPVNTRYAPPELERALRRARPRWLILDESRTDRLAGVDPAVLAGVRILVAGRSGRFEPFAPLLTSGPGSDPPPPAPDRPAALFFTSGSSGEPKGVVHSHGSALAMLTSTCEAMGGIRADDVVQVCDPLVHVSGFIETLSTLLAGGKAVLYDGFDLQSYTSGLLAHRPTLICTHVDVLARLAREPRAEHAWFSSLRGVYTGGDTVPGALQRDFRALTGLPIGVGYGLTEAIWLTVERDPGSHGDNCIGTPVDGTQLRTDEKTGELLVRGPMVMSHYWDDKELTRLSRSDGWLRTGDMGSQDADGLWWFRGRIKDLIVRRTSKITPGEVESAIDEHPEVADSAVVAAPDSEQGQVPVAFVVPRQGSGLTAEGLMTFLKKRIAAYKLPSRIHFLDALPLTASGKISHRDLQETGAQRPRS
ncbi:class I adenylate-forming enzyme family protein [Streptomyces sp. WMMB 322]|uniref:class I adenylate-forming enzyme family protein n=1 Tax=Streptomyces sp. WMMB 322 TaxID=1286821 RepID=UPI0006E45BA1|nr:class I adenylate-forming enzyme family protein [Streptomyces sp. WMMB 322]SCK41849.1 long-chain acyl-CoA synthetase [Streptomyces sp. WMMB 322]